MQQAHPAPLVMQAREELRHQISYTLVVNDYQLVVNDYLP